MIRIDDDAKRRLRSFYRCECKNCHLPLLVEPLELNYTRNSNADMFWKCEYCGYPRNYEPVMDIVERKVLVLLPGNDFDVR